MKDFTVYILATGQVVQSGTCNDEGLATFPLMVGQAILEVVSQASDYMIVDGAPVVMPVQPSPDHIFDYTTKQWIDPRTLADLKATKWLEIKQARNQAEFGGFTWEGSTFDSDLISQSRIQGAAQLATLALMNSQPFSIEWVLADNSTRVLTAQDMLAVGTAIGTHIATQHSKARLKRNEITLATTATEVEAVVW